MYKIGLHTYSQTLKVIEHPGAKLSIGKFCSIGPKVKIFLGENHRTDYVTTYPFGHINQEKFPCKNTMHPSSKGDVVIGNDVWLGFNATIMSGVTIGDGAVIAANSHVVKDVPPYSITGGNPAQHIKYRFKDDVIQELLRIKWWNKTDQEINKLLPVLLDNPDIEMLKNL